VNYLISIILGLALSIFTFSPTAWATATSLGVNSGHLAGCPQTDNCVVSQSADQTHRIAPIIYQTDLNVARETLLKVLTVVPRTQTIEQTSNYIRAESTSRIFKFVDDVEFYFPSDQKVIEMRSASRVGESDLGVNRRRLEQIRLALQELKI
jgi:uncharacterized protein (DUF1499 family)